MKPNYIIVSSVDGIKALEVEVNKYIDMGYRPCGGITIRPNMCFQPMLNVHIQEGK